MHNQPKLIEHLIHLQRNIHTTCRSQFTLYTNRVAENCLGVPGSAHLISVGEAAVASSFKIGIKLNHHWYLGRLRKKGGKTISRLYTLVDRI